METNRHATGAEPLKSTTTLTTPKIFEWPVEAEKKLLWHYRNQVEQRGRSFLMTDDLSSQIRDVARFMTGPDDGRFGIILSGSCGNGKTTLMNAFRSVAKSYGMYALGTSATRIASYVRNGGALDDMMNERALCIDDLGNEPSEILHYGSVLTPLRDILEYRYERRLFTFVTTNLGAADIEARYGKRVRDRCREMFFNIRFGGGSFR